VTADIRADPETVWVRAKWAAPLVLATAAVVALYMRLDHAITTMQRSLTNVHEDINRLLGEVVSARQFQAWLELSRAANRGKTPDILWPDLPK
jgi:hypothetical protein